MATAAIPRDMTIKYFDTFEYVRKSKEIKDPEDLAAYQVKQIESAIETAVQFVQHDIHNKDFSTKADVTETKTELKTDIQAVKTELKDEIQAVRTELKDEIQTVRTELKNDIINLDLKIAELRYDMLKFIIWTGLGGVIALGGMMARGFHWI